MPRPQFTLRSLLVAMLVVAAFVGGVTVGLRWNAGEMDRLREAVERLAEENRQSQEILPRAEVERLHKSRGRIEDTYDKFDGVARAAN